MYLHQVLNLNIKDNYQVFPVESRGIDFVGYVFFHRYILLRKSLKLRICKLLNDYTRSQLSQEQFDRKMCSYFGWLKYSNSKHFLQKASYIRKKHYSNWQGQNLGLLSIRNKDIRIIEVIPHSSYFSIHYILGGKPFVVNSRNMSLYCYLTCHSTPFNFKYV